MIIEILKRVGPSRSSIVVKHLMKNGLTEVAARKKVSRATLPIKKYPIKLLPKNESFLYLQQDENKPIFWRNLLKALRDTGSIFGITIDSLLARKGIVLSPYFPIISGAPSLRYRSKVSSNQNVLDTLIGAKILSESDFTALGKCIYLSNSYIGSYEIEHLLMRNKIEPILLNAIKEWLRKIGLVSYDKVAIKAENIPDPIQGYSFDITAPSYVLALQKNNITQPGFVVADLIFGQVIDKQHLTYFLRKIEATNKLCRNGIIPILFANVFTREALKVGKSKGIMMITFENLFGKEIFLQLKGLMEVLLNISKNIVDSPEKIDFILKDLSRIEGASINIRGILFELLVSRLNAHDSSINMGVLARNDNGDKADIDVFKNQMNGTKVTCIECKGKSPGVTVTVNEIKGWLKKIPIFEYFIRHQRPDLNTPSIICEFWTTGKFEEDAIQLLLDEKAKRKKIVIDWKDGYQVLDYAKDLKESVIVKALNEHFIQNPLNKI